MRSLWILRHAKAVPHTAKDHGRRLNPRGIRQCDEVSEHLAALGGPLPDVVLSSSAARAMATAKGVLGALGSGVRLQEEPELYQADALDVVALVRQVDDGHRQVMVVGHNPTLLELLLLLLAEDDDDGRRQLDDGLPTAALAVVDIDLESWSGLEPGSGRLQSVFIPKAR